MTKNEFKQQLIISMAGDTATFWKSHELISRANRVTLAAEKAGITFDGDTRQSSSDDTQYRKGMQNAVVINGTVYELVDVPHGSETCKTCAMLKECKEISGTICVGIFGGNKAFNRHFKKL